MGRKAPTVPGSYSRRRRTSTYDREISHPVAKLEKATVTLRPVYLLEVDHAARTLRGFALKLAVVKRAIVAWSLKLEPAEGIERLPESVVDEIYEHVQILDSRRSRRRSR